MTETPRAIRGMNDILPAVTPTWRYLESVVRDIVQSYGYSEIRLPLLEYTELFKRSIGAATDIVAKEITGEPFTFEREVDGDGVVDVVRLRESIGSGASSTWGTLTLSASGEVIEISRDVSFSAMINIHIVPPALVGKDRPPRGCWSKMRFSA